MNGNKQTSIFKKYILKAILAVLVLFLVAGIAYGGWILFGEKRENSQFPNNVPGGEGSIESETPDLSSNWQWHSDVSVGYDIQYPKSFKLEKIEDSLYKESFSLYLPADKWKSLRIFVEAEKYPTEVTAREWAGWHFPVTGSSDYTDVMVSGIQGIERDYSDTNSTAGEVILAKKNTVVRLRYITEEVQRRDEVMELVNRIIDGIGLTYEETQLPIPDAPNLTLLLGDKPFIQINWNWEIADYFNVYRTDNPSASWERIIENFPQKAHTAVDYDIPKNVKILYYRITSLNEESSEESPPSEISSVKINLR